MTVKKKKAPKKRSVKPASKKQLSQNVRIMLASSFLLGFVVISLFALVTFRTNFQSESPIVHEQEDFTYEEHISEIHPLKVYHYDDVYTLIENQLINGPDSMGWRKLPSKDKVQVRQIFGDFPSMSYLGELAVHIEHTRSPAELKVSGSEGIIHLYWQDDLRLELQYKVTTTKPNGLGKVAIVMDDMGGSLKDLKDILSLDIHVTPAILPGTSRAKKLTNLLQQKGREYLIHMPMQPRSYPRTNPGSNALLLGQSEAETIRLVREYIKAVPGAVGGNNHMGSRYTQDAEAMKMVLREMQRNDLFFIDSKTIGDSVAFAEARKMGMKTATRNIFLDNKDDVAYIRQQIRKMVGLARDNREIIAICHPHDETMQALRLEQVWMQRQGVTFVSASELVHTY